jgi:hypothetical protein
LLRIWTPVPEPVIQMPAGVAAAWLVVKLPMANPLMMM